MAEVPGIFMTLIIIAEDTFQEKTDIYRKVQWQMLVFFLGRNTSLEANSSSIMEIWWFVKVPAQDGESALELAFCRDICDIYAGMEMDY